MARFKMPLPGRVQRAEYERTLSPACSESESIEQDELPPRFHERVKNGFERYKTRVQRHVFVWAKRNVQNVAECVGGVGFIVWMLLRWHRLHPQAP